MTKKRNLFQKVSYYSAILSFLLMIGSGIMMAIKTNTLGSGDVVSASFMATTFFFLCVGVVLWVFANSDLPDLKIGESDNDDK